MNKLQELSDVAYKIVEERDWEQFHNIQNLAMNLVGESSELMELFTWLSPEQSTKIMSGSKKQDMQDEIADIFFTVLLICRKADIDLEKAFLNKVNREKKIPC